MATTACPVNSHAIPSGPPNAFGTMLKPVNVFPAAVIVTGLRASH
jgi:hypothetical protein